MAYFRFHKSKSVLPGVRVNLSKSGASVSVGPKGAKVNVGPQGVRTTVSLPGTGLSLIDQKSWNPKANRKAPNQRRRATADVVDTALDVMTKAQQRALMEELVEKSSLAEVKAQRDAFEAYVAEHAAEIEDGDKADLVVARKIYADAIASKEAGDRRQVGNALVLAAIAALTLCYGVVADSGWLIAGSLVLFFIVGCTQTGQRLLSRLSNALSWMAAVGGVILLIAFLVLFAVSAITGNLGN